MYQVTPDNPDTQNWTQKSIYQYSVDIMEDYLADFGPHLDVPPRTSEGAVVLSFQLGEGDNMLKLDLVPAPWRPNRSCRRSSFLFY